MNANTIRTVDMVKRVPITLTLSIATLVLHLWSSAPQWLGYDWHSCGPLQYYRILTCNWLHYSWNHLAWDLAVFFALGSLLEMRDQSRYALMLLATAFAVPVVACITHNELGSYRGLSGIDSGLFAMLGLELAIEHVRKRDWRMAAVFATSLVALIAKITWEIHLSGNLFVSDHSFIPIPIAHMTGAIIGVIFSSSTNAQVQASSLAQVNT